MNPYEPEVDWFSRDKEIHSLWQAPEPKRRFMPSKWEEKKYAMPPSWPESPVLHGVAAAFAAVDEHCQNNLVLDVKIL